MVKLLDKQKTENSGSTNLRNQQGIRSLLEIDECSSDSDVEAEIEDGIENNQNTNNGPETVGVHVESYSIDANDDNLNDGGDDNESSLTNIFEAFQELGLPDLISWSPNESDAEIPNNNSDESSIASISNVPNQICTEEIRDVNVSRASDVEITGVHNRTYTGSLLETFVEEPVAACNQCNRFFKNQRGLKVHKRSHRICQFCNKNFQSKKLFSLHDKDVCIKKIIDNSPYVQITRCEDDPELKEEYSQKFKVTDHQPIAAQETASQDEKSEQTTSSNASQQSKKFDENSVSWISPELWETPTYQLRNDAPFLQPPKLSRIPLKNAPAPVCPKISKLRPILPKPTLTSSNTNLMRKGILIRRHTVAVPVPTFENKVTFRNYILRKDTADNQPINDSSPSEKYYDIPVESNTNKGNINTAPNVRNRIGIPEACPDVDAISRGITTTTASKDALGRGNGTHDTIAALSGTNEYLRRISDPRESNTLLVRNFSTSDSLSGINQCNSQGTQKSIIKSVSHRENNLTTNKSAPKNSQYPNVSDEGLNINSDSATLGGSSDVPLNRINKSQTMKIDQSSNESVMSKNNFSAQQNTVLFILKTHVPSQCPKVTNDITSTSVQNQTDADLPLNRISKSSCRTMRIDQRRNTINTTNNFSAPQNTTSQCSNVPTSVQNQIDIHSRNMNDGQNHYNNQGNFGRPNILKRRRTSVAGTHFNTTQQIQNIIGIPFKDDVQLGNEKR